MLLGRATERRRIDDALARARAGASATLLLIGEPGIGKSALLGYATEQAAEMRVLRARGIESEAQIPFGSLLELLRPALDRLSEIPRPHAAALEAALALRPGGAHERFAVGAATLGLLAAVAEDAPLVLVIDDAHWLDRPSGEAILFALRRLLGDRIAAVVAQRAGEPSPFDGSDLPQLTVTGLSAAETRAMTPGLPAAAASRLHELTKGNPLAIEELAAVAEDLAIAPHDAPAPVPQRVTDAYVTRLESFDGRVRRLLCLAAAHGSDDLPTLERAAARLDLPLAEIAPAEQAGLIRMGPGRLEFRHPLARSAVYAASSAEVRRDVHRVLAAVLPDRDLDRRAWHLAAAAVGLDETASGALEQAGARSRDRSAFATASAAYEQAGRLTADLERSAQLMLDAGEAAWNAGLADRATTLLDAARSATADSGRLVTIDELAGHIATRRGPIMRGHEILVAAAERAPSEQAVAMLAEAAAACLYAGEPVAMLAAARRARELLPIAASPRARFLAALAEGMAETFGGDAAAGATAIRAAIGVAQDSADLEQDLRLLPWLAVAPIFLRESQAGRTLLEPALQAARSRAALSTLPFVLNLRARDHATTERWSEAEMSYLEAADLARETEQGTELAFSLAGLAWLYARRGRVSECRQLGSEALALSRRLGCRFHEVWALAALGELELVTGDPARAMTLIDEQRAVLAELGISDPDLSLLPELVEAALRTGDTEVARTAATEMSNAAAAKGQPWSEARAARCRGLVAGAGDLDAAFAEAFALHERTADVFETARSRLAYGERLRRARSRREARTQLRAALEMFERLGATPWAERARAELAASGETLRRRDPTSIEELTPQELQIARLLAGGRTTRETAGALFISPKTVEYHLRHVYLKLGVNSRDALAAALVPRASEAPVTADGASASR